MAGIPERRLFDALATLSCACAAGDLPETAETQPPLDDAAREVLGEAALAVAYGAFAAQEDGSGAMPTLLAGMGLLAAMSGEEPDPPAEIMAIAARDDRVEDEVDRAGEALDAEFGRDAEPAELVGALEARILGTALTLAGCTLPEGVEGQAAVRLRAARALLRLAAGLVAMNAAAPAPATGPAPPPPGP